MDESLFETIATHDPQAFADALQQHAPDHYQRVFQAGHSTATAAKADRLKALEQQLADAEAARTEASQKVEELTRTKPDVDKVRAEYEATMKANAEKAKAEADRYRQLLTDRTLARERAGIVAQLVDLGFDKWFAEKVVDQDALSRARVDDDFQVNYYETDGRTPMALPDGVNAHARIAKDILQQVPEALRPRPEQRGSNLGGSPNGGGKSITRTEFDAKDPAARMDYIRSGGKVVEG